MSNLITVALLLAVWVLGTYRWHQWFREDEFRRYVTRYGSKNTGPFQKFGPEWFSKYQKWYLFLLNFPVVRYWGRWILRIHRDCPNKRIVSIAPHSYTWANADGTLTADFRTHWKFSKRTYFAFRYVWWAAHALDWCVNRLRPEPIAGGLVGCDELTAYPAAGANSPCDGYAVRHNVNQTFTDIIAGAGTVVNITGTTVNTLNIIGSTTTNQFARLDRGILNFDTSSLAGSVIDTAVYSGAHYEKTSGLGEIGYNLVSVTPASTANIVLADYTKSNYGSTSYGNVPYSVTTTGYYNLTLNASGKNYINKTGVTSFGTVNEWDFGSSFTGTWASGGNTHILIISADQTGTTTDPKLVVTYIPETTVSFSVTSSYGFTLAAIPTAIRTFSAAISYGFTLTAMAVRLKIHKSSVLRFARKKYKTLKFRR